MAKMRIDPALCTRCGRCVLTCPAGIFTAQGKDIPGLDHPDFCIRCGHCAAICPQKAIRHVDFPPGSILPLHIEMLPSADQVLEMLRMRRSMRAFEDRRVDPELLAKIIEGASLAPSAHNIRNTEFVIIQDKTLLRRVTEATVAYFAKTARHLRNPIVRALYRMVLSKPEYTGILEFLPEFDLLVEAAQAGKDPILRGAPCLLICHSEPGLNSPEANAILALHNATLVCQALGLGSVLCGYVVGACQRDKALRELLSVPPNHRVCAAMALGHPRFQFENWIRREIPDTQWV